MELIEEMAGPARFDAVSDFFFDHSVVTHS